MNLDPSVDYVINYSPSHVWAGTCYASASIRAYARLARRHGYSMVLALTPDVYLVRDDELARAGLAYPMANNVSGLYWQDVHEMNPPQWREHHGKGSPVIRAVRAAMNRDCAEEWQVRGRPAPRCAPTARAPRTPPARLTAARSAPRRSGAGSSTRAAGCTRGRGRTGRRTAARPARTTRIKRTGATSGAASPSGKTRKSARSDARSALFGTTVDGGRARGNANKRDGVRAAVRT